MPVFAGGGFDSRFSGGTGSDECAFGLSGGGEEGVLGLTDGAEEDGTFGAAFSALFGFVSLGFVSSGVGSAMFCSGNSPAS